MKRAGGQTGLCERAANRGLEERAEYLSADAKIRRGESDQAQKFRARRQFEFSRAVFYRDFPSRNVRNVNFIVK